MSFYKHYKIQVVRYRVTIMALHPIWKLQLTLVSYGNEYLSKNISIQTWLKHSIFRQQQLSFRDLLSQHLLAQHFQVWLEGLKAQGYQKLSLHCSSVLNDEKNPNANIELIPYGHFIVSHHSRSKTAWIFGQELAEWYRSEHDYIFPPSQKNVLPQHTMWALELDARLSKKIDDDLFAPNWDDVNILLQKELFETSFAASFVEPENQDLAYDGLSESDLHTIHKNQLDVQILPLLPAQYHAPFAHQSLHRLDALSQHLQQLLQTQSEDQMQKIENPTSYINFAQKIDTISPKIIAYIANHYPSAQLTPPSAQLNKQKSLSSYMGLIKKAGGKQVMILIFIITILSVFAYYFTL